MKRRITLLLVAYDIPDDRRRLRVSKLLMRLGRRVQYSVFVIERSSADAVATALRPLIVAAEDDVRVHVMCARCVGKEMLMGRARRGGEVLGFKVI